MSPRVDTPAKEPSLVTKQEFEQDWNRGYAVTVWKPATEEIIRDRRSSTVIRRPVEAILNLCCMLCSFSTVVEAHMQKHMEENTHYWPYSAFMNPYGHFQEVTIEGIEPLGYNDYVVKRIGQQTSKGE